MNVFIYDNGNNRLEINEPEILLIKEFKALSDRDKSKNKTPARWSGGFLCKLNLFFSRFFSGFFFRYFPLVGFFTVVVVT